MLFTKNTAVEYSLSIDKMQAEADRKAEAVKRLDFYHGNQTPYVYDRLSNHFSDPDKFSLASLNIVKKIVDAKSAVYIRDATRTLSSKKDHDLFKGIQKSCGLGLRMRQANRLAKLCGTVLLKVVYRNGKIDLDILTPDILDVETGVSPMDLRAVVITYYPADGKVTEVEYSRWTPETIQRLDYKGNVISSVDNPYQFLPFVPIFAELPISDFWVYPGDTVISMQELINERLVDLAYALRMQSFSIPVVKGAAGNVNYFDPGQAISLNSDPNSDFKFAAPNGPIPAVVNAIDYLIRETATMEGLPASYLSSKPTERKSGYALLVQNKELQEIRDNDIDLFKIYEQQVFETIKQVWNVHNSSKFGDSLLKVNFFDPSVVDSENKSEFWSKMVEMGVYSPVDLIMKLDPDLSREEAEQKYKNNIAFKGVKFGDSNND
jgi:hypothetical protein